MLAKKQFVRPVLHSNLLKLTATLIFFATITVACKDSKKSGEDTAIKSDKNIPGLQPVDIYLNLEKQGFVTDKHYSTEFGNSWDCKNSSTGIDYVVSVFSSDISSVETLKATAMLTGQEDKGIEATKPFLKYIASVPFEGNDPAKVAEWIEDNFDKDKQTLVVSNVRFTIYAPTAFMRMLRVELVD